MAKTFARRKKLYRGATIPHQTATKCIFCGSSGPLTLEHVYSKWTHRFLPPRAMKNYSAMHVNSTVLKSDRTLVIRPGDIRDWQIACVCGGSKNTCNNGWMREKIEEIARPIMAPLIEGNGFLRGETTLIHPAQQRITAYCGSSRKPANFLSENSASCGLTPTDSDGPLVAVCLEPPGH
jgi:hypothetical protein